MLENRPEDEGQDTHHYKRVEKRPEHAQGHIPVADCKVLQDETFEKKPIVPVPHGCNVFRAATRRPDSPIVVPGKVKPQFRGEIGVCDVKVTRIQRRAKLRRSGSSWYLHCNGLSHVSRTSSTEPRPSGSVSVCLPPICATSQGAESFSQAFLRSASIETGRWCPPTLRSNDMHVVIAAV